MNLSFGKSFHTHVYEELAHQRRPHQVIVETKQTKHFVIQERELSYRLYPHFHPYVGQLTQRLLRAGVAGLQAADTDYAPDGAVLPRSTEVVVAAGIQLDIPADTTIALVGNVQATLPGNVPILLSAGMPFKVTAAPAILAHGIRLVLTDGFPGKSVSDPPFTLAQRTEGDVSRDTRVTFPGAPQLTLHDGAKATLPTGTEVAVLSGAHLAVPAGTEITLMKCRPLPVLYAPISSSTVYDPSPLVRQPHPVKDLDFSYNGAYSAYNWELFFHVPLTIAIHLSRNQRFAESQRWFHYLFDPTDDSDQPAPARYWKVRPFQENDVRRIGDILVNLATGVDPALRDETLRSIEAWKDAPFRPHVVARYRHQAYMYKTVMAYLDNLIAWGDSLFRQDTGEAVDEAMMVYVLAANILGPRPQAVPAKGSVRPQTYANLRGDLDKFGNAMRDMEADLPFDLMPFPTEGSVDDDRLGTLRSMGKALYFCVPRNDKLLGYWDTVADRLFKIRNSLNIQGVFRQLALFEPPIDPAMLARATAAGLDVSAIVSGLNQPLPLVRFQFLVQKAAEIVQEVKTLGNNLLTAIEKEDGEALALLRARHELTVMQMVEQVKYGQHQEAIRNREAVEKTLTRAVQGYVYHERLLGKQGSDIKLADRSADPYAFNRAGLDTMTFTSAEPEVGVRAVPVDIAASDTGSVGSATLGLIGAGDITGGRLINRHEATDLNNLEVAQGLHDAAHLLSLIGKSMIVIPEFGVKFHFWGLGGDFSFGGRELAELAKFGAEEAIAIAGRVSYEARRAEKIGSYANRERDWAFHSNDAAAEINQIYKQLRAAEIREAVAESELKNQRTLIKQAQEIEFFLTGEKNPQWKQPITPTEKKTAGKGLYTWMKRELRGLHAQCYQFAFDVVKKAERALQHELGDPELSFLQYGYLSGHEGLLAGERLYLDVKRMEMAYHEQNQREYELTRHVSVLAVDPMALLRLRKTGRCTVKVPEELFDMDGPGHYFRRIRSVGVSLPCVTGPYASVNCRLTLLKSSIRKTQALRNGAYARDGADDDRFSDFFGSLQSIVTSSAQNDTGLFDANQRDDRYLPFEYSGAVSEWQLELPADPSRGEPLQFDYDTISDVVLHVRYTAREGGGLLRREATRNLSTAISQAQATSNVRLFSVRHDFPNEWANFRDQTRPAGQRFELALKLRDEHYPFWSSGRRTVVKGVRLLVQNGPTVVTVFEKADKNAPANQDVLARDASLGNLVAGSLVKVVPLAAPVGDFKIYLETTDFDDLWIAVTWGS
jgi:hypothetical protein